MTINLEERIAEDRAKIQKDIDKILKNHVPLIPKIITNQINKYRKDLKALISNVSSKDDFESRASGMYVVLHWLQNLAKNECAVPYRGNIEELGRTVDLLEQKYIFGDDSVVIKKKETEYKNNFKDI